MDTDWADIFYLGATQKAGQISDTDSVLQQCLNQKERQMRIHYYTRFVIYAYFVNSPISTEEAYKVLL